MNPFGYTIARSVDAAVRALGGSGLPPKILAGGTTLVDLMRLNVEQPTA